MKERPILFSGEMVRAILDGRKTQTRRIYKPKSGFPREDGEITPTSAEQWTEFGPCPYGQPGDRLWVREAWNQSGMGWRSPGYGLGRMHYRADPDHGWQDYWGKWRSPIHMPRWASRLTLEITGVRVERLQEISNADCWAEGMSDATNPQQKLNRRWFSELWESINGPGSWHSNPWVWVINFKRVEPR